MKKTILYSLSILLFAVSCSNGPSTPPAADTSQKVPDTFNNRKDTRVGPDSTNVPNGPTKQ